MDARHVAVALLLTSLASVAGAQVTVAPGYSITQLATGIDRPFVAAGPGAGGYTGGLYVTTGATKQIVIIDAAGNQTLFADLSGIVPFDAVFWPTFDRVGSYGGALFVDDDNNVSPDRIYRVTSSGTGSVFASGPGVDNDVLVFDPFGAFGGSLFLHVGQSLATLYKVTPAGASTAFATGIPDSTGQIAFSPGGAFGTSMYIVGESNGRIYTAAPGHVAGQPASLFAGFQANSGSVRPGGIAISGTGPFGTDVMYVMNRNTLSIVTVNASGQTTGTFATGLSGVTVIDLPRTGDFADTMILTDLGNGSIYVVRAPAVPALAPPALLILAGGLLLAAIAVSRRRFV